MIILGAKGHAIEILEILIRLNFKGKINFYDDVSIDLPEKIYGKYRIIRSSNEAMEEIKKDRRFVIGVGAPKTRELLAKKFLAIGGVLESVISTTANIGVNGVKLGSGLNIMSGATITTNVTIGDGVLLNAMCTIHHDVTIGDYTEISPGVHITGNCQIGKFCRIGTGAILIPNVKIGNNVVIGAGAVVIRDVKSNCTAVGNPARVIKLKILS